MGTMSTKVLRRLSTQLGFQQDWYLILVGAAIGTITGFGAVGFAFALHWLEHEVGVASVDMGWIALFLFPMLGLGLTGLIVNLFAKDAKGHGVPQVIYAIIKRGGKIPARIGAVKIVASIATVGSGGSSGAEGPIVQIGATVGSLFGQRLKMDREAMGTLVGCGAAAGIAAIFNAPIAGVFFVLEILLRDFSVKIFTPIVIASVFASVTTQAMLEENTAIFATSSSLRDAQFHAFELPTFLLLGGVCGLIAVVFNRVLHFGEDAYDKLRIHPMLKPLTGGFALGVLALIFLLLSGASGGPSEGVPAFYGNGYETIKRLIDPLSYGPDATQGLPITLGLMGALVVFKCVATTFTLASGGSGGVFAPSLFIGAASGALVGIGLDRIGLLPSGSSPASYALVGMAAVVAGAMHAPLTAILMLFELTRNIYVVLPIMLAAVVATVVAQLLERDSIYTYRLRREGVAVSGVRDLTLLRKISVRSVNRTPLPEAIFLSDPLSKLIALHATHRVPDFPVVDANGAYVGMVTGSDMRQALIDREAIPLLLVAELVRTDLPTIESDETLDTVLDKFATHDVSSLCLRAAHDREVLAGLITRSDVMKRYQNALEMAV